MAVRKALAHPASPYRRLAPPLVLICLAAVLAAALPQVHPPGDPLRQSRPGAPLTAQPPARPQEAARLINLGVAYMNQQRFAKAQKFFEQAVGADPHFPVARLNLAIALLAQQKLEPARSLLEEVTRDLPADPYGFYNVGLVYKDLGDTPKAIDAFRKAAELAPADADTHYFLGMLLAQQQNYNDAIAAFQRALALNPFHVSSEFGLARSYQRKGQSDAARQHLARFQKLTQEHLGSPLGAGYGDQGRFSFAEFVRAAAQVPPPIPVHYSARPLAPAGKGPGSAAVAPGPATGACFFDYDNDGRPDLFLVSAAADGASRLWHNLGNGQFEDTTLAAGLALPGSGLGCAAGDFDNDGHTDLAVCLSDGVRLLRNTGHGTFLDVTQAAGIRRESHCVAVTWADYDHDGDLDLYVTQSADSAPGQPPAHNVLWRNNGNGTFTDVSAESGLGVAATGAGVVTTDFDNDRATDFVLAGGAGGAAIYRNPREGKFSVLPVIDFAAAHLPPAVGVLAFDFDKDGWMDLAFTHAGDPGVSLWRNVEGKQLVRVPLPDFAWQRGWGLAALDYDNDGWLDLLFAGEAGDGEPGSVRGELRLLRNLGSAGWADVTRDTHLDVLKLRSPRALAIADIAGSGSPDILLTQFDAPPLLLRNQGGNRHNWLRLDLKALADNKSAVGVKVELFAGPLYQKWEVQSASGYLGQNAAPILAGLGDEREADVVRLLWPTGVPQDEVKLLARQTHTISELDRRGSSCPVLFAWNGREYAFISDMLGPGVVGHWVAPGERDIADPTEYLKVSGRSLRPLRGLLSFRFLEPMEETVYLDHVRLLAIDHPSALDVYPNERFVSAPPFPEFRVIASRDARPPAAAWDDRGRDVLPLVARRDRRYVSDFQSLPWAGFAALHWIELDLGEWDARRPLRLLLDGYTDYFTATSMYAADQAGVKVIAPYLEALDAQGRWVRVVEDLGFPAGLARTMVADLTGKLPSGTRRVRIVTNLKIYWDAVRIDSTPDPQDLRVSEVPLAAASLDFLGYPRELRGHPPSDVSYSYAQRSRTGPYARAAGNYTRYGDVRELLRAADDRFAIFGSGEGVKLDFDPRRLPPLPQGWVRDYFFYADGFEKDMDFYAAHAFTVEPLPRHILLPYPYPSGSEYPADPEHLSYQLDYNTRPRSDRLPATFRYAFPPPR